MTKAIGPILLAMLLVAWPASSQDVASDEHAAAVDLTAAAVPYIRQASQLAVTTPQSLQPAPVYYSHAYDVRATIHKYASFTTLPLVGSEFFVGQSLFDSPSSGKKSVHVALGSAIGGLFAVNSVTGVWNLVESRKDPNRHGVPWLHSVMMLGADAGFVATAAVTPGGGHDGTANLSNKDMHRTLAFTSMGLATASYLIMLFGDR